jgi:hypothetical protein
MISSILRRVAHAAIASLVNRLLRAQTLTVSFKKPFDLLAETTTAVPARPMFRRNVRDGGGGGN